MNSLRSLGISKPAGLGYLIAEGFSQTNASDYAWSCAGEPGDELLVSGARVIWTRYGAIHRIYSFEVEKEPITQALFAYFPQEASVEDETQASPSGTRFGSSESVFQGRQSSTRAVVVILKTQAHIYVIGGTTHVVNLPFEVSKAFSIPYGLILQRTQVARPITISFQNVKTPANSFAPSQSLTGASPEAWRHQKSSQEADPFWTSFWKASRKPTIRSSQKDLPHHIYLRDPLTEIGIVGEVVEKLHSSTKEKLFSKFSHLPSDEDVIYLSANSEILDADLLIALTWNSTRSQYTIWKVVETPNRVSLKRRRPVDQYLESRRRSSHGPGTGTTTPGLRASINPRESFGAYNDTRHAVKSRKPKTDAELVNQLDAAFEGTNTAVSQTSRRISSLLARSDLATGNDAAGLTDPAPTITKRGASFGGPGTRASFGGVAASFGRKSNRFSSATHLEDLPSGDISDDTMDTDSDNDRPRPGNKVSQSLQRDVAFVKIHSFTTPDKSAIPSRSSGPIKPTAVVLQTPAVQQDDELRVIAVYAHAPSSDSVYCTNIGLTTNEPSSSSKVAKHTRLSVRSTETLSNVVGICKLGKFPTTSLLILSRSENGTLSLMKHIPWKSPQHLELPTTMLRRNPFHISIIDTVQRRREGGLRAVLSDGIDQLSGLRSSALPNQFDIAGSKNTWHRFELRTGAKNEFIQKLLDVCQCVIAGGMNEQTQIYQLWDSVKEWLNSTGHESEITEWRIFLVMMCSLFVPYLPKAAASAPRARRKAGLLRSSSGAQVDTESFDAMILLEDKYGISSPSWLNDTSWQWAAEPVIPGRQQKSPIFKRINIMQEALQQAREFAATPGGQATFSDSGSFPITEASVEQEHAALTWILAALHLVREEEKLNLLNAENVQALTPLLAQVGGWLGCAEWDWREPGYYSLDDVELERWNFDETMILSLQAARPSIPPPSIFAFAEEVLNSSTSRRFPSVGDLPSFDQSSKGAMANKSFTPRTMTVLRILEMRKLDPSQILSKLTQENWTTSMLENLPEGVVSLIRSALAACQVEPPLLLSKPSCSLIGRDDLAMLNGRKDIEAPQGRGNEDIKHQALKDYHQAASNTSSNIEEIGPYDDAAESDRQSITRLIFSKDQRFAEAARLVHPLKPSVTRCVPEPDWTDQDLLEAQQELAKIVAFRTLSVSPGRAMLFFNARHPLLTEKFPIHGFTLSTIMKPSNITVAADRAAYTEEKVSWAFFHAGVEAGLSISRAAKGIDTSWILFNKPKELGDRHAGFLLALGLNGHLRTIAKWVAFKYLTPKHTMTSIGLLLGLAASHIGSMDALITRLLSVHVTRMLPPGAAELNLSPTTQTTGIMALGLLYYNTQHRRMTEVMLSEIENIEQEDGANPMNDLRDEGYRLAAGFALGYINLGQGRKTKGLNDMKIVERLLSLVAATRKISLVHILDKATAGATIAIALIFLKTGDRALANTIDIPDTTHQFEYVRPDIFLLRTVARHLIMWDEIEPSVEWINHALPKSLQKKANLKQIRALHTEDLPLYNILTGLCLAIGLRFAGSAREDVRDLLMAYLDQFTRINRLPALHYDSKLTRITSRNCQDVIVLAAAAVMAGTGDIQLLRRFRSLHGRATPEIPYGSHLAAHQAIGLLFLGGGTHTLSTSNLAIASLLCAFYPLFPASVQDNKAHLQAFRHFWVLAADARCLTIRETTTLKPLSMKIVVVTKTGQQLKLQAPCLLPELDTVSRIVSDDHRYWPVTLDFESTPNHLMAFRQYQSMFVQKRGPYDSAVGVFSATVQTMNEQQILQQMRRQVFEWTFNLPALSFLNQAEKALLLPGETSNLLSVAARNTVIDDRLALERECLNSSRTERLWSLRLLFAWTEHASKVGRGKTWIGKDLVEFLQATIALLQQE